MDAKFSTSTASVLYGCVIPPTATALRAPLTPTPIVLAPRAFVRADTLVLVRCARTPRLIFIPAAAAICFILLQILCLALRDED